MNSTIQPALRALTALMTVTAMTTLAAPLAAADANCQNYGTVFQVGVHNEYGCEDNDVYVQHCEQDVGGAGAGAGAGGPGSNEAGAEATAGTECQQNVVETPNPGTEPEPKTASPIDGFVDLHPGVDAPDAGAGVPALDVGGDAALAM